MNVWCAQWVLSFVTQAYAQAEAKRSALPELPKILSFHRFSKREKDEALDWKKAWLNNLEKPPSVRNSLPQSGIGEADTPQCSSILFWKFKVSVVTR